MKINKAFTLVELIVVITILAILWTIAFLSIQSYTSQARDSNRISNVSNIKKWLETIYIKNSSYPIPEWDISTWIINWNNILKLWYFWQDLTRIINMSELPKDPLNGVYYKYWILNWAKQYQIWYITENSWNIKAKVEWNYIWFARYQTLSWNCLTNLPTLLFNNTWSVDLLSDNTYFIVNNWDNLPYSINNLPIQNVKTTELIEELTNSENSYITWCVSNVDKNSFEKIFSNTWLLLSFNTKWLDSNNTENIKNDIKQKLFIESSFFTSNDYSSESTPNWNSNYFADIKISNSSTWNLSQQQISFSLDTQNLINSWKLNSTCSNINFYDSDKSSILNYWIEKWTCNSSNTIFHLKIPQIPIWDKTIYAKLTNLSDSNNALPETIFELYDDFNGTQIDTNKWIKTSTSYVSWSVLYKNMDSKIFKSVQTFWVNYKFIAKCKFLNNAGDKNNNVWISGNGINLAIEHYSSNTYFNILAQSSYSMRTNSAYKLWDYSPDWHILSIKRLPNKIIASINWVSKEYLTTNTSETYLYFWNYWQNFWWCDWIHVKKLPTIEPSISININ